MESISKNNYDYYEKIKYDAKYIFYKYNLSKFIKDNGKIKKELLEKIYIEKLYNLFLDIANQQIYSYKYIFKRDDIEFIIDFELDKIMYDILDLLQESINYEKNRKN